LPVAAKAMPSHVAATSATDWRWRERQRERGREGEGGREGGGERERGRERERARARVGVCALEGQNGAGKGHHV